MASMYGSSMQPALKNNVDMQLQTAFANGNWLTVFRLAEKRAKVTGDSYYEAVKICAESRLDGITEKSAAAVAVDAWIKKGTVPKDYESIELLEWACTGSQTQLPYSETFGTLRLRWAKANSKDVSGVTACLQECLLNWDLVNSQQIAIILDKSSNSNDRRFMYWGILLTHMLSTSPQCPAAKQKIYGMLAQKQLEKAAELAEAHAKEPGSVSQATDRSLHDEEEFILYFRVLAARGSAEDFVKAALNPHYGALRQLRLSRKQPFLEILSHLKATEQWDIVFDLCKQALGTPDGSDEPSLVACDLQVWKSLVAACQMRSDVEKAFDEVQALLRAIIDGKSKRPQMYTKNLSLALLEVMFNLPPSLLPKTADGAPSPLVEQLLVFIDANIDKASVFGDVKGYVEKLYFAEARDLLQRLESATDNDASVEIFRKILAYKLRYLLATCPQSSWPTLDSHEKAIPACKFCTNPTGRYGCNNCFQDIAEGCLKAHSQVSSDTDLLEKIPKLDKDPRIDLALVAISCLLRLAGVHKQTRNLGAPWISGINVSHFMQAVIIADHQLQKTPNDIPLLLLLMQLYLLLGCGSRALQLWNPLGVKRTVLDALGPLFYDRLSTISPGIFHGTKNLLESLRSYYATVLRHPSAVKIWDAFSSGSYSSILDMAEFNDCLHVSCTRAMSVVEERRVGRAFGAKLEDLGECSIFSEIAPNVDFMNVTDHGSTLQLESSNMPKIFQTLSIGPGLSNTRMHLGLLAEQYLDAVTFKPPKEYKPAKTSEAAQRERLYILESLEITESAMTDFLHAPGALADLTAAEYAHYTILMMLSYLSAVSISTSHTNPAPSSFAVMISSVTALLDALRLSTLGTPSSSNVVLCTLTDLHSLSMLRESAIAIKQTAAFIASYHEREAARDRSGKTGLHKEVLSEMRTLKALSTKSLSDIKLHIKSIKDKLGEPGWLDRVDNWVTQSPTDDTSAGDSKMNDLSQAVLAVVGGTSEVEYWAGSLLDEWRETIKGWGMLQLE